jgi:hypothetical protein
MELSPWEDNMKATWEIPAFLFNLKGLLHCNVYPELHESSLYQPIFSCKIYYDVILLLCLGLPSGFFWLSHNIHVCLLSHVLHALAVSSMVILILFGEE